MCHEQMCNDDRANGSHSVRSHHMPRLSMITRTFIAATRRSYAAHYAAALLMGLAFLGCSHASEHSTAPDRPVFAKGGGGSGGAGGGGSVTVTAVFPAMAPTDTVLDVEIDGSNFARGARAKWLINGDTTQVLVLSTSYVSSSRLRARIQVRANATLGDYDVAVELDGGKKGIGAEVFEVILGDPKVDWLLPLNTTGLSLRSDGQFAENGYSVYANGVCGVGTNLFATSAASGSGDATMHTNANSARSKGCPVSERTVRLRYADGYEEQRVVFVNLREIQNATYSIPIGQSALRIFALSTLTNTRGLRCPSLRWRNFSNDGGPVGDLVVVTRLSSSTWHARTQPYPANRAICLETGQLHHLDVEFLVRARSLPWDAM